MLRIITNIIISSLLLVSTTGIAVSRHYCEEEFISVELKTEAGPCCNDDMCCHTETQLIQVTNDFLASAPNLVLENPFPSDLILTFSEIERKPVNIGFKTSSTHYALPLPETSTRLALKQVYRL